MNWSLLLPDPARLFSLLQDHPTHFLYHWWATLSVSAIASLLAIGLSLVAAVLALRYRLLDSLLAPPVAVSQSFPLQAIAPLIIIVMGIGFHTTVTIAFVIAFFPIYGSCVTAVKTTPKTIRAHFAVCRATFVQEIRYGRIPAALPAAAPRSSCPDRHG